MRSVGLIERLVALTKQTVVGDPLAEGTQMGPLASSEELKKVMNYMEAGKSSARLIAGGDRPDVGGRGYFVNPTIFADVAPSDRIAQEEIFGPVLTVTPFDNDDEAVELANGTGFGLAAGVQTGDHAVLFGNFSYLVRATGRHADSEFVIHMTFSAGKVVAYRVWEDTFGVAESFRTGGSWKVETIAGAAVVPSRHTSQGEQL